MNERTLDPEVTVSGLFFTYKFLILASVLDTNIRLPTLIEDFEREMPEVCLHLSVIEFAADETLGIKDTII
jgi:hypothetical protein